MKVVGYIWKKNVVGAIFLFWAAIPVLVAQNTYYSYQSGNWDISRTWTTDPSGTTLVNQGVPTFGDRVVILNGRTVTIPSGVQANVSSLVIQQGAVLDLANTFNHNFGNFSGSGLLRLSPTTSPAPFPAFATGNFVQAGGGTIEYYVGATLPPSELQFQQLTYNNLVINLDQSSRIVYPMADMTINGNLAIKKGTFRICDNSVPASDLRLTIDVKGDVNVGASGAISVGTRATNTSYLPFSGAPFTTGTPDTGYVAGSKVSRYYDIYHKFYIGGSLINKGTVKFISNKLKVPNFINYSTEAATTVRFYGAHDANLLCYGTTDFYNLIVDKGSDQTYRLNLDTDDPVHFRLYGRNDQPGGSRPAKGNPELRKALWIKNGTLRLTGYATLPSLSEGIYWSSDFDADFYIPANGALILDGPNVTVMSTADNFKEINAAWGFNETDNSNFNVNPNANCSSFSIYGKLIVNDGYLSGRNSGGFIFWSVASGLLQINGGVVDGTQLRSALGASGIASFIQTGGILNLRGFYLNKTSAVSSWNDLRTVPIDFTNHTNSPSRALQAGKGTLNIEDPANLFTMTGGTMNIYDVCDQSSGDLVVDIKSESQNIKVTGGTINIFSSSGLAEEIYTTAPLGNLSVSRTAGNASVVLKRNLKVLNNLSLNSSAVFNASSFDLAVGGNFTIQNNAVYSPGNNTTIFDGNQGQSFTIGGNINGGLNNLSIANASNTIISNNILINANLSIDSACILNDGGYRINVGSDGIATNNSINNSGKHVSSINGGIVLNGTGNQSLGGNGNGIWGNLNLNKSGGSTMLTSAQAINGDLRLANSQGILNIGSFRLSLSGNSHVYDALTGITSNFNSGRMILTSGNRSDGGLNKTFNSANSFVFPVGTTSYYTPVSIGFTSAPAVYGSVNICPVAGKHPLVQGNNALAYYWKTSGTGFSGISPHSVIMKYYYNDAFVQGTEADYVPAVFNSSLWSYMNDPFKVNDAENEILCDTSSFITGEYTAGQPDVFGIVQTFYSRDAAVNIKTSGASWDDAGSWSTDPVLKWAGTAASSAPCAACQVVIGDGSTYNHKINITSNGVLSPYLQIRYGSTLDLGITAGHNLSIIDDEKYGEMGTLRISSATNGGTAVFPQGDFVAFTGKWGGTVEYYSDATNHNSFAIPLISESSVPSGARPLDHYRHLKISPADGKVINLPDRNLNVSGNLIVTGNNTGAAVFNSLSTRTLTIDGNLIIQSGTLRYNNVTAQTVTVKGDVHIESGTFEVSNSGGTPSNLLYIGGNLNNNGIFNMNNTGIFDVTFTGSTNAQMTGTGSNNFHLLTLDKGISPVSLLDVRLAGSGTLTLPNTTQALFLNNGTFRVSSAPQITLTTTSDFLVPETGCLSVNGGSVIVASGLSNNGIKLNGKLEVLAGKLMVGDTTQTAYHNDIEYADASNPQIEIGGGYLALNGQIRRNTQNVEGHLFYKQTGGTVKIMGKQTSHADLQDTRAKLEICNSGSKFVMSGGDLIIKRGGGADFGDIYLRPDTVEISGGTLAFSHPGGTEADQTYTLDATCPLFNLSLYGNNSHTSVLGIHVNPVHILNNLLIGDNLSTLNSNNLEIYIGGDFTNNGLYNPGTNTTHFNGSGAQAVSLNSATSFYKLTIDKPGGVLTFAGSKQPVITDTLSILNGTLNDGTATVSVLGDVINNAVHSSGSGNITLAGTRKQMISGSGNGQFGNLVINNGKDNGAALTANMTINGILTLGSGPFYLDDNLLTLGAAASIGGSPGATHLRNWIMTNGVLSDGGVRKVFPSVSPASFTFPVGIENKYTPASYTLTYTSPGTVTVKPVDGPVPSVTSLANDQLQYYWNVTSAFFSGLTSADHMYQFLVSDVKGNKDDYLGARYNMADYTWTQYTSPGVVDVINYTINLNGLTYIDGDYTCGIVGNFGDKPVYYSYDNAPNIATAGADWNNAGTWATGGHNGTVATVPPAGNPMVIKSSHIVHVNNDDRYAYSIINNGVLNLHSTTGHNFGHVSGAGRIIMSNTPAYQFVFPGGNYDDFMNTAGSTIEYYGIGTNIPCISPIIKSYQNLEFTGPASKNLSNVNILVRGNLKISESQVINSLYDKNITLWGKWSDNLTNGFVPGYGTVNFSGTVLQTINSPNPEHFYNFSVNNAAGVTLNGTSEIANSLCLENGNINTDATNSLTLTSTNPLCISGGSPSSFVNGPLKKYILNGSYFDFPVGKSAPSSRYGKVGVLNTSTTGTQVWTAEYYNSVPPNNNQVVLPLDHISDNEYWNVAGPSGGSANVSLRWDALSNIQPLTASGRQKLRVAEWLDGSGWTSVGNKVTDRGYSDGNIETENPPALDNHLFTLGIEPSPTAVFTGNNISVCNNGETAALNMKFTGTAPWGFTYRINGTDEHTITNVGQAFYNLMINGAALLNGASLGAVSKDFTISLTDVWDATGCHGGRDFLKTVTITLKPAPSPVVSGRITVGTGETNVQYTNSTPVPGSSLIWTVVGGTIVDGDGTNSIKVDWGNVAGNGSVTVTETAAAPGNCSASYTLHITITEKPSPSVQGNVNVCGGANEYYSTADVAGHTYLWTVTGGSINGPANASQVQITWNSSEVPASVTVNECNGSGDCTSLTYPVTIKSVPEDRVVSAVSSYICAGNVAQIKVANSENHISYQLRIGTELVGTAVTGNGGDLIFSSAPLPELPATVTFIVRAITESPFNCAVLMSNTPVISVSPLPDANPIKQDE